MTKETFKDVAAFRQALIEAGVKPVTVAEHIGRPADNHFPDDRDGVEHWRLPCHKINDAGDVMIAKVGFWKDPNGRLGAPGGIYPDRTNDAGVYNKLVPVVVEEDTTSLGARALAKANKITAVWSAWLIDNKPDCVIVGCYQEVEGSIEKKAYAVRVVGKTLEIKPYIEVVA